MKIIKKNMKLIIGILIGVVISATSVYALTVASKDVSYDGKKSNVQDAIDDLYSRVNGSLKETVLWTNPNPNSGFSGGNITLSDDIDNYAFIKVVWKGAHTDANNETFDSISTVESLTTTSTYLGYRIALSYYQESNNRFYVRQSYHDENTSKKHYGFGECLVYFYNVQTQVNNNRIIPLYIIGLK